MHARHSVTELDTVVSRRGKSKACVATFVERKGQFYIALPITDRSASSMDMAIQAVHLTPWARSGRRRRTEASSSAVTSIRTSLGMPLYFADPYASWQRGSKENANSLLREFFLIGTGTDFAQVGDGEIAYVLAKINGRPRKCLGWRTAHEAFNDEVLRLI